MLKSFNMAAPSIHDIYQIGDTLGTYVLAVPGACAQYCAKSRARVDVYYAGCPPASGAFAVVKRAVHKRTGKLYAVKIVDKRKLAMVHSSRDLVKAEVEVLRSCQHRCVWCAAGGLRAGVLMARCCPQAHRQILRHVRQQAVPAHRTGVVRTGMALAWHPCARNTCRSWLPCRSVDGGELFDKIIESGTFPEMDAKALFRQIAKAIAYLHERNISHR